MKPSTFLVLGATGETGRHFVPLALRHGHTVRALVRDRTKLTIAHPNLQMHQGSITDALDLDELVSGTDFIVSMLGDRALQQDAKINTAFVKQMIPAMRRQGVKRFLYQAGGLSRPYKGRLTPILWTIRHTVARSFEGQHRDNEGVINYLAEEARDIEWIVHRAGIVGDGPTKGTLIRSRTKMSIGTFGDCAFYNYRTLTESAAIHTCDFSHYANERDLSLRK